MKKEHPMLYALMVAFGLKDFARDSEEQFASARELGKVSERISADTVALIAATDEAAGGMAGG